MQYEPLLPVAFTDRVAVQVPRDVRDAIRRAAEALGLTVSDYARLALCERLAEDGQPFGRVPLLSTSTLEGLQRRSDRDGNLSRAA